MRDSSFIRYGDMAQKMLKTGQIGRADGIEIVMVAGNSLPAGAAFLLVHKDAVIAPRQLQEYKIYTDPHGISGTLCEGAPCMTALCRMRSATVCTVNGTWRLLGTLEPEIRTIRA